MQQQQEEKTGLLEQEHLEFLRLEAERRVNLHINQQSTFRAGLDPEYLGVAGEWAFACATGYMMDTTINEVDK